MIQHDNAAIFDVGSDSKEWDGQVSEVCDFRHMKGVPSKEESELLAADETAGEPNAFLGQPQLDLEEVAPAILAPSKIKGCTRRLVTENRLPFHTRQPPEAGARSVLGDVLLQLIDLARVTREESKSGSSELKLGNGGGERKK